MKDWVGILIAAAIVFHGVLGFIGGGDSSPVGRYQMDDSAVYIIDTQTGEVRRIPEVQELKQP